MAMPRKSKGLLLTLALTLALVLSLGLVGCTAAQRGGVPPPAGSDVLGASCARYPPNHHTRCMATTQTHLRRDGGSPDASLLPPATTDKITAFLTKPLPATKPDAAAAARAKKVTERIARALLEANDTDASKSRSDAFVATALDAQQTLARARHARWLFYGDSDVADQYHASMRAWSSSSTDLLPKGIDLEAMAAQAFVRTVAGVFTCYADEADPAADETQKDAPTPCDVATLARMHQLVDVLVAYLDSARSHSATTSTVPLTHFLRTLPRAHDGRAELVARCIMLDLVSSALISSLAPPESASGADANAANAALTSRALYDIYAIPDHFARPGVARPHDDVPTAREAREAAWRALARVQSLGATVRATKRDYPFWFGLMKSGVEWVLNPIAKMMLKASVGGGGGAGDANKSEL
ncbi:hypothetical protein BC828DRAFT_376809 [Blastocladiella britannica]|nr:hypothetical protein BC828DRAFT_376809 [Blastocladiella britannica]